MPVVRRSVAIRVDQVVPPAVLSALLAAGARRARDEAIASGQATPSYETFVDGRPGAAEDTVKPDGFILYKFNLLGEAAKFGLAFAAGRSPVREGQYRASWFIVVDGRPFGGDPAEIPQGATVMITNHAPYHRKIDTGAQITSGRGIVEATRQAIRRRFPTLKVQRAFVTLPGGYVLKGRARRGARVRAGRRAGDEMTYPAVIITQR